MGGGAYVNRQKWGILSEGDVVAHEGYCAWNDVSMHIKPMYNYS